MQTSHSAGCCWLAVKSGSRSAFFVKNWSSWWLCLFIFSMMNMIALLLLPPRDGKLPAKISLGPVIELTLALVAFFLVHSIGSERHFVFCELDPRRISPPGGARVVNDHGCSRAGHLSSANHTGEISPNQLIVRSGKMAKEAIGV